MWELRQKAMCVYFSIHVAVFYISFSTEMLYWNKGIYIKWADKQHLHMSVARISGNVPLPLNHSNINPQVGTGNPRKSVQVCPYYTLSGGPTGSVSGARIARPRGPVVRSFSLRRGCWGKNASDCVIPLGITLGCWNILELDRSYSWML